MQQLRNIGCLVFVYVCLSTAVADIKVQCQGRGEAVYLIGGGPAFTTWNLQPIQKKLSSHYKTCRWDMRGVGENAGLIVKPQVTALSQWIQDMHDVLPQEPVVLWGHSWGALQVLLFAKKFPKRVSKLILSNPVDPALHSLEHIEQKRFLHPQMDAGLKLEDIDTPIEQRHNFRSKIASYFVGGEQGWEYASGFSQKDSNSQLNIRIWDEYRKKPLTDANVRQLADKISALIFCQDDVLQPENMSEYRRILKESKFHVLMSCAHFPWEENPDVYYRALFRIMSEK